MLSSICWNVLKGPAHFHLALWSFFDLPFDSCLIPSRQNKSQTVHLRVEMKAKEELTQRKPNLGRLLAFSPRDFLFFIFKKSCSLWSGLLFLLAYFRISWQALFPQSPLSASMEKEEGWGWRRHWATVTMHKRTLSCFFPNLFTYFCCLRSCHVTTCLGWNFNYCNGPLCPRMRCLRIPVSSVHYNINSTN